MQQIIPQTIHKPHEVDRLFGLIQQHSGYTKSERSKVPVSCAALRQRDSESW